MQPNPSDDEESRPSLKRPRSAPASRPPQHPNSSSGNLRGITDLLGAGTSRADSLLGDTAPQDAWASIIRTVDGLTSSLPADLLGADAAAAPQGANDAAGDTPASFPLQHLAQLPLDFSLKTRMHISSDAPLAWTRLCSQRESYLALHQVSSGSDRDLPLPLPSSTAASGMHPATCPSDLTDAYALFHRRLIHFRFPACPQSAALAAAWPSLFGGARAVDDARFKRLRQEAYHRLALFQSALQSVHAGLCNKLLSHYYVVLPKAVALFYAGDGEPTAVLSPASPGIRALLSDYVVSFVMGAVDAGDDVYISVRGAVNVQTFYNFISAAGHQVSGAVDVPTILADSNFVNAGACLAMVHPPKVAVADSESTRRHSVQIRGLLTPRQLQGICQALARTQHGRFHARVDVEPKSLGLNHLQFDDDGTLAHQVKPNSQGQQKKGAEVKPKRAQAVTSVAAFADKTGLFARVR